MKVRKTKEVNNNSGSYIAPDFKVTNVIVEQHILANGSVNTSNSLDDVEMKGDYW